MSKGRRGNSSRSRSDVEKEQFWRWVLEEHASSGLSVRAFCKRESLSEPSFYAWRRTIRQRDLPAENLAPPENHGLIPVNVIDAPRPGTNRIEPGCIEIIAPGNLLIRLKDDCQTKTILCVLTALRQSVDDALRRESPC